MKTRMIAVAVLAAVPLSAANAMNLALFLEKAAVLEKKGAMAVFTSDFRLLKREVQTASAELRAERVAAEQAGRKPAYCPPAHSGFTPKELLAQLRTIPAEQRGRVELKDGLRAVLKRKYPCPA